MHDAAADICRRSGEKGLLLPATSAEYDWPDELRAVVYGAGMVYLFLGVSMIADTFVASIEVITSKRRKVRADDGHISTAKVWNETVANLSLMALGSSAPEIFLSVIDLFRQKMMASELGAFTIVGSASFNLFMIVAVCVAVIPSAEGRKIKEIPVFYLTALFSMFAYLWLIAILMFFSPDVVDIWEAAVTLLLLPLLIWVSYRVDTGSFGELHIFRSLTGDPAEQGERSPPARTSFAGSLGFGDDHSQQYSPQSASQRHSTASARNSGGPHDFMPVASSQTERVNWRRSHHEAKHRLMASITGGQGDTALRLSYSSSRGAAGVGRSLDSRDAALSGHGKVGRPQVEDEPCTAIQFLAEYQCMSKDCTSKPVMLVRSGHVLSELTVAYAVSECEAVPRQAADRVRVADSQGFVADPRPHRPATSLSPSGDLGPSAQGRSAREAIADAAAATVCAGGYLTGESVVSAKDLSVKGVLVVRQGVAGTVMGPSPTDPVNRITVAFSRREDHLKNSLNVVPGEIRHTGSLAKSGVKEPRTLAEGEIVFDSGDTHQHILLSGAALEIASTQLFLVSISHVQSRLSGGQCKVSLGALNSTQVAVTSANSPGALAFASESVRVRGPESRQVLEVVVVRSGGCSGFASCEYHTESLNAVPGFHYAEVSGQLEFGDGVTEQTIEIEIFPKSRHRCAYEFLVILEEADGAPFDACEDGAPESAMLLVEIPAVGTRGSCTRCLDRFLNIDAIRAGVWEWLLQAAGAPFVNGSREEQAEAGASDWVFHVVSLPWKMLFVLVPSTSLFGGWLCFVSCLLCIAILTGAVADLAELFGCVLGVANEVTAITFVALGTSMPDLFASRAAAVEDHTADASVVNVTGSNSVNVFLGLGLPWTIGAVYWAVVGRTTFWEQSVDPDLISRIPQGTAAFVVPAKDLAFNVLVFSICCLAALFLLFLRRRAIGIELGGPGPQKVTATVALVSLWLGYISMSCWHSARWDQSTTSEKTMVVFGVGSAVLLLQLVACGTTLRYSGKRVSGIPGDQGGEDDADKAGDTSQQTKREEAASIIN